MWREQISGACTRQWNKGEMPQLLIFDTTFKCSRDSRDKLIIGIEFFYSLGRLKPKAEMPDSTIDELFVAKISNFVVGFSLFSHVHHGYYWLDEIIRLGRLYYPNQHVITYQLI